MSDLGFSREERAWIELAAREQGVGSRVRFYAAVFTPVLLFGGYGALQWDVVALGVALVGLWALVIWRVSEELAAVRMVGPIFRKIVQHERRMAGEPDALDE